MEQDKSDEARFVYHVDGPDLQKLASYRIALLLWQNYIFRSNSDNDSTSLRFSVNSVKYKNFDNHSDLNEMVECLKMPQSIEKLLKNSLTFVAKETSDWLKVCGVTDKDVYDLNWCVWFDDGRIDHKRSALKFLSSNDELSNVQKFALMCRFCLEDEIVKFSLDSLPEDFTSQSIFRYNNSLIQYWYYRLKNDEQNVKTLTYMAVNCDLNQSFHRWTAFEYFWYHLNANQQTIVANYIIAHKNHSARFLERLLGTMYWYQQRRILATNRTRILCKFASESDSLEAVRWTWTHSKGRITVGSFVEFVGTLVEKRLSDEEWMSWLVEVWDSAHDKYKTYAAKKMKHRFYLGHLLNNDYSRSSFKILSKILSLQSIDSRKEMIFEQACHFGPRMIDHHSMNEMLRLHLPNADDQKKFKKLILESDDLKSFCVDLIVSANFDRLNMLLEFYLDTPNDVLLFKEEVLKSKILRTKYVRYHIGQWNAVSKFIAEDLYPENAPLVLETKKGLICVIFLSYFHHDSNDDHFSPQDVTVLIQTVESEFTRDDVIDLKDTLWTLFQLSIFTCYDSSWYDVFFNERCFLRFVKWCVGDGDSVSLEFGGGGLVNTIFDGVFSALNKNYERGFFKKSLLTDLEKYLSWHFENYTEMRRYKMDRFNSFQVNKIFRAAMNRPEDSLNSALRELMNWFSQYNQSTINIIRFLMRRPAHYDCIPSNMLLLN